MTHWTVIFQDAPEMTKIRADKARRDAHIAYVRGRPGLQIGGTLALCPQQDFPGAIWTVEAETRAEVERLVLKDPYYVPSLRRYSIDIQGQTSVVQGMLA
ncbi:YciI family protein [Parasedimentitalea psychrophila]|uniref:YCII-related domain-containing protein n=1 Tax=Parasedimentitalea psychrophila TaxID=2997337 RepID=A0A9Y2KWZ9_9RHOB|nr:hypothetical protein [Parasedimentitalea psychrophila]WIY24098.1 hypothetical protein QPJ95_15920 [Parasedimentitalea psychrophila]